jgi:uncharacterized membrane protein
VIMVVGFIVFLVTDGTPGGLTGMQGFFWGAGIAFACVVVLVLAAIVSLRGRSPDAANEGVETVRAAMHSHQ